MTISKKTSSSPAPVRPAATSVTKSLLAAKVKPVIPLKTKHELIRAVLQEKDKVSCTAAESEEESSTSGSTSDSETEGESTSETSSSECNTDDDNLSPRSLPLRHPTTRAGFQTPKPVSANSSDQIVKDHEKKLRKEKPWTICLTHCRYEIVRTVAKLYNLVEVNQDEAWNIYWTDYSVSIERVLDLRRFQMINHFPGMNEICRKDLLARNLNRMQKIFPSDYKFFPKTWSLPADLSQLQEYASTRKNKIYICKPGMGCQGRGIFLIRNIKDLNPFGKIVCQLYLAKPFLIDGYKFDLRIYALITSCDPLRVYVYKEGLARFATAKYKPPTNNNTENSYMHLTNYAVNKFSVDYIVDDESGSKRKLTAVYKWLSEQGHNTEKIIAEVDEMIVKTILSAQPILKQNYNCCFRARNASSACFEILGFDIILDHKLKPYVLEVNCSPSFCNDTDLDKDVKEKLLQDTFAILNLKRLDRRKLLREERKQIQKRLTQANRNQVPPSTERIPTKQAIPTTQLTDPDDIQFAFEVSHCGGYRLVYPSQNSDKYDQYFKQNSPSLYQGTTASQARTECIQSQLQEYNRKKLVETQKRVDQKINDPESDKNTLPPKSPGVKRNEPQQTGGKNLQNSRKSNVCNSSFVPMPILRDEELERMNGIMNRAMIVRSLGIELKAFQLLCHNGTIKEQEEKLYTNMYGCCKLDSTIQFD